MAMPPTTYDEVLIRNIRAARSRLDLDQADVVARMRDLGFATWHRQTMGKIERAERRVLPGELCALAEVLETTMYWLLAPAEADDPIAFPDGRALAVTHIQRSIRGAAGRDPVIRWDNNKAVFSGDRPMHFTPALDRAIAPTALRDDDSGGESG